MSLVDRLAVVACDAWWSVCESDQRWAATDGEWRQDFRRMAEAALRAGQAARGLEGPALEDRVAAAMNAAWLEPRSAFHKRRYAWTGGLTTLEREVFLTVARAVMTAAREIRETRKAVAA